MADPTPSAGATPPHATPHTLRAVDDPPHSDRRRHAVSGGGLYLTWRQAITVLGVVATVLTIGKGVWPVLSTAATIPATVERINASTTHLAAVVETLQRDQLGMQRDQAGVQRDQADVRRTVDQLGARVAVLEPTVAALDALRGERGRQIDGLTGRVTDIERSMRGGAR